ncbi:MAG: complex I NDUFA9 subunit family protein [Dehalococcoidia bacterium]|jgi:NADH dehydrogenase
MILVTGGTGFIGRHLVARLAESGRPVRVAARGSRKVDLPAAVEQARADVVTGEGLAQALAGVDMVANLAGIIVAKGAQTFDAVIHGGTVNLVREAEKAGVKKLVYVSAIGAAPGPKFPYWHAKWEAEQALAASKLNYTILRPSLLFGPEDDFFNRLARLIKQAPVVPIAGNGKTRFQPIWVEDVVTCVAASLSEGAHDRQLIEIGGPEYFTYNEIIDLLKTTLGKRRLAIHLPLWLMRPAARTMSILPSPPVTIDQLNMLAKDNTTALDAVPSQFGFAPKSLRDGLAHLRTP